MLNGHAAPQACTHLAPTCTAADGEADANRPLTREALRTMIEEHNGGVSAAAAAMRREVTDRTCIVTATGGAAAAAGQAGGRTAPEPPHPRSEGSYWLMQPLYSKVCAQQGWHY